MPFKSEAQRRWMYANDPSMARKWSKHTPKGKKLPQHVKKHKYAAGSEYLVAELRQLETIAEQMIENRRSVPDSLIRQIIELRLALGSEGGSILPIKYAKKVSLRNKLENLRQDIAEEAQGTIENFMDANWEGEGECEAGVCANLADNIAGLLKSHGIKSTIAGGEDHVWNLVHDGNEIYHVDIHPYIYEHKRPSKHNSMGYKWYFNKNVNIQPEHVSIAPATKEHLDLMTKHSGRLNDSPILDYPFDEIPEPSNKKYSEGSDWSTGEEVSGDAPREPARKYGMGNLFSNSIVNLDKPLNNQLEERYSRKYHRIQPSEVDPLIRHTRLHNVLSEFVHHVGNLMKHAGNNISQYTPEEHHQINEQMVPLALAHEILTRKNKYTTSSPRDYNPESDTYHVKPEHYQDDELPYMQMADWASENPEHPLAKAFNWPMVYPKLMLDREVEEGDEGDEGYNQNVYDSNHKDTQSILTNEVQKRHPWVQSYDDISDSLARIHDKRLRGYNLSRAKRVRNDIEIEDHPSVDRNSYYFWNSTRLAQQDRDEAREPIYTKHHERFSRKYASKFLPNGLRELPRLIPESKKQPEPDETKVNTRIGIPKRGPFIGTPDERKQFDAPIHPYISVGRKGKKSFNYANTLENAAVRMAMRRFKDIPLGSNKWAPEATHRHVEAISNILREHPNLDAVQDYVSEANRAGSSEFHPESMINAATKVLTLAKEKHKFLNLFGKLAEQDTKYRAPLALPQSGEEFRYPEIHHDIELEDEPFQYPARPAIDTPIKLKPMAGEMARSSKPGSRLQFLQWLHRTGKSPEVAIQHLQDKFWLSPKQAKDVWGRFIKKNVTRESNLRKQRYDRGDDLERAKEDIKAIWKLAINHAGKRAKSPSQVWDTVIPSNTGNKEKASDIASMLLNHYRDQLGASHEELLGNIPSPIGGESTENSEQEEFKSLSGPEKLHYMVSMLGNMRKLQEDYGINANDVLAHHGIPHPLTGKVPKLPKKVKSTEPLISLSPIIGGIGQLYGVGKWLINKGTNLAKNAPQTIKQLSEATKSRIGKIDEGLTKGLEKFGITGSEKSKPNGVTYESFIRNKINSNLNNLENVNQRDLVNRVEANARKGQGTILSNDPNHQSAHEALREKHGDKYHSVTIKNSKGELLGRSVAVDSPKASLESPHLGLNAKTLARAAAQRFKNGVINLRGINKQAQSNFGDITRDFSPRKPSVVWNEGKSDPLHINSEHIEKAKGIVGKLREGVGYKPNETIGIRMPGTGLKLKRKGQKISLHRSLNGVI